MVGAGLGDVERRMFIWVGHTWTCAGLTAVLFQSTCAGLSAVLFQSTCAGLSAVFQSTCAGLTAMLFQSTCAGLTAMLFQSTCAGLTAMLFQSTCAGLTAVLFQSTCAGLTAVLFQNTKPLKVTGSSLQHAETRSLSVNLQYRYMVRNFSNSILCGFVLSFSVWKLGAFSLERAARLYILEGRGKGKALVVESLHLKDGNTQLGHF